MAYKKALIYISCYSWIDYSLLVVIAKSLKKKGMSGKFHTEVN